MYFKRNEDNTQLRNAILRGMKVEHGKIELTFCCVAEGRFSYEKGLAALITAACLAVAPVSVLAEEMSMKYFKLLPFILCFLLFLTGCGDNKSSSSGSSSYSSYSSGSSSYSSSDSNYSYSSNSSGSSSTNASNIFNNLSISDFSASKNKYQWSMRCKVKNNNSFTVHGYFNVNFYDNSGSLVNTALMPLPDVESGETVSCSTIFPDEDMSDYSTVDFSQAALTKRD